MVTAWNINKSYINTILNIFIIIVSITLYIKGECDTELLGKCSKNWKLTLGIPIGLGGVYIMHSWIPFLCVVTFLISGEMPYGDNHWWTKFWGKRKAITICGMSMGLATIPYLGLWGILQAVIAGVAWYIISIKDDEGIIKEPWVAAYRTLFGIILILFRW